MRRRWEFIRGPAGDHTLASWWFLRLLGLIYLSAFASISTQILGLAGASGIVPASDYLSALHQNFGSAAYYLFPNVYWVTASDLALSASTVAGAFFAALLLFDIFTVAALFVCFVLYLSVFYAAQEFTSFQWDLLLLESGFLALFLPVRSGAVIWLFRWLVFRFMFLSGWVKYHGDADWLSLSVLEVHFQTQPLPTVFAWYAHQLPAWFLKLSVAVTLIIELIVPFLLFLPRPFRMLAGACFILLETMILITGNYNFFNLLTIFLCIFLFDDDSLKRITPAALQRFIARRESARRARGVQRLRQLSVVMAAWIFCASALQLFTFLSGRPVPGPLAVIQDLPGPLRVVNTYGPFAAMTDIRHEILIQGSHDQRQWHDYRFPYKPGDPRQAPRWVAPHQPRLDWQMWFAALSDADRTPWFLALMYRLLEGSPAVTKLFADNPFPDKPPKYLRAMYYEYRFSSPRERRDTGAWWVNELRGMYLPPVTKASFAAGPR